MPLVLKGNFFQSALIRNDGNGKFTILPLPQSAQMAPLNGMIMEDFDGDGNLDILASTNDFGTEVTVGRYDALNGIFLKGDGQGNFQSLSILQSGIFLPGDGKAMIKIRGINGRTYVIASQNRGALKVWQPRLEGKQITLQPNDDVITLTLKNGKLRRQELYFGNSFLSQSTRFITINPSVTGIEVTDLKKQKRKLAP